MSLIFNAKTYTADRFLANIVRYIGALKTITVKDDLQLLANPPKPVSNHSGVAKSTAKLTRTLTLTGALTPSADGIVDITVHVPVGAASADIDSLLNDSGAFLSSASFKTFAKNQQISF